MAVKKEGKSKVKSKPTAKVKKELIKEAEKLPNQNKSIFNRNKIPYDKEVGDFVCDEIATCTFGLRKIISFNPGLPSYETINQWRLDSEYFGNQYARAKQIQADLMIEECLDIIDDGRNDWMEKLSEDGTPIGWVINGEHVQRSRARVDTRKWIACKLAPKIYGDKTITENHNYNHEKALKDLDE